MDQYTSPVIKTLLNESICGAEMFEHVFALKVIHLDYQMLVGCKQIFIQRPTQY